MKFRNADLNQLSKLVLERVTIRSGRFHGIGDRKRAPFAKHCGKTFGQR